MTGLLVAASCTPTSAQTTDFLVLRTVDGSKSPGSEVELGWLSAEADGTLADGGRLELPGHGCCLGSGVSADGSMLALLSFDSSGMTGPAFVVSEAGPGASSVFELEAGGYALRDLSLGYEGRIAGLAERVSDGELFVIEWSSAGQMVGEHALGRGGCTDIEVLGASGSAAVACLEGSDSSSLAVVDLDTAELIAGPHDLGAVGGSYRAAPDGRRVLVSTNEDLRVVEVESGAARIVEGAARFGGLASPWASPDVFFSISDSGTLRQHDATGEVVESVDLGDCASGDLLPIDAGVLVLSLSGLCNSLRMYGEGLTLRSEWDLEGEGIVGLLRGG